MRKTDSKSWDKNINKTKRMMGEEYIGYTRSKDGVVKHNIKRKRRKLGPKCTSNFCKKASTRCCNLLTEDTRKSIFEKFWNMSWEQKRLYVLNMVLYNNKKRSYTKGNDSGMSGSFQYYIKMELGKMQVCKKHF